MSDRHGNSLGGVRALRALTYLQATAATNALRHDADIAVASKNGSGTPALPTSSTADAAPVPRKVRALGQMLMIGPLIPLLGTGWQSELVTKIA